MIVDITIIKRERYHRNATYRRGFGRYPILDTVQYVVLQTHLRTLRVDSCQSFKLLVLGGHHLDWTSIRRASLYYRKRKRARKQRGTEWDMYSMLLFLHCQVSEQTLGQPIIDQHTRNNRHVPRGRVHHPYDGAFCQNVHAHMQSAVHIKGLHSCIAWVTYHTSIDHFHAWLSKTCVWGSIRKYTVWERRTISPHGWLRHRCTTISTTLFLHADVASLRTLCHKSRYPLFLIYYRSRRVRGMSLQSSGVDGSSSTISWKESSVYED
jgi:hypothetical protein